MTKSTPILLIGAGGHCKSCIDLISIISNYEVGGIVDKDGSKCTEVLGQKVIGTDSDLEFLVQRFPQLLITTGQIKSPLLRSELFLKTKNLGASFPVIISPTAYISNTAIIDEGTISFHQTLINTSVQVGKNCIINNKALIEHESTIGSHCHVSTGALINGGVVIDEGCFIGSGAIIHEGVKIGRGSVISAGKIVQKDIPNDTFLR